MAETIDPITRDAILVEAKRANWDEKQCIEIKSWVNDLFDNQQYKDLFTLPHYYFYVLSDEKLLKIKEKVTALNSLLETEIARRAK